jgi:MoaA/NifB/PqqE/SkfB family radical SAM enzyme
MTRSTDTFGVVGCPQRCLDVTEEAPGTRYGQCHGAQFTEYTVPFGYGDPLLRDRDFIQ